MVDFNDPDERTYKASRVCRVLGNPKTFELVRELERLKTAGPSELAHATGLSYSTVCIHLRHLREIDVVRSYKSGKGNATLYRIRSAGVGKILKSVEAFLDEPPAAPAQKKAAKKKGK